VFFTTIFPVSSTGKWLGINTQEKSGALLTLLIERSLLFLAAMCPQFKSEKFTSDMNCLYSCIAEEISSKNIIDTALCY
jgi:hypothetical protein